MYYRGRVVKAGFSKNKHQAISNMLSNPRYFSYRQLEYTDLLTMPIRLVMFV